MMDQKLIILLQRLEEYRARSFQQFRKNPTGKLTALLFELEARTADDIAERVKQLAKENKDG